MAKYYVTRGSNRTTLSGQKVNPATKGFDSLDKARAYGYRLVEEYKGKKGYFNGLYRKDKVGLDIAFISKDSPNNPEFATIIWGKPNIYYPDGVYYVTFPKNGNTQEYQIDKTGKIIRGQAELNQLIINGSRSKHTH